LARVWIMSISARYDLMKCGNEKNCNTELFRST
jgi:hypothetical protein